MSPLRTKNKNNRLEPRFQPPKSPTRGLWEVQISKDGASSTVAKSPPRGGFRGLDKKNKTARRAKLLITAGGCLRIKTTQK